MPSFSAAGGDSSTTGGLRRDLHTQEEEAGFFTCRQFNFRAADSVIFNIKCVECNNFPKMSPFIAAK